MERWNDKPQSSGSNKWLIWVLVFLVVVAVGFAVWWFFVRDSGDEDTTTETVDTPLQVTPAIPGAIFVQNPEESGYNALNKDLVFVHREDLKPSSEFIFDIYRNKLTMKYKGDDIDVYMYRISPHGEPDKALTFTNMQLKFITVKLSEGFFWGQVPHIEPDCNPGWIQSIVFLDGYDVSVKNAHMYFHTLVGRSVLTNESLSDIFTKCPDLDCFPKSFIIHDFTMPSSIYDSNQDNSDVVEQSVDPIADSLLDLDYPNGGDGDILQDCPPEESTSEE